MVISFSAQRTLQRRRGRRPISPASSERLGAQPDWRLPVTQAARHSAHLRRPLPGRHFFPGFASKAKVFFVAMVAKAGKWEPAPPEGLKASNKDPQIRQGQSSRSPTRRSCIRPQCHCPPPDDYIIEQRTDTFSAIPRLMTALFGRVVRAAHASMRPSPLHPQRPHDMVPAPELALSTAIRLMLSHRRPPPDAALATSGTTASPSPAALPRARIPLRLHAATCPWAS